MFDASLTLDESAGRDVPVGVSDGAPGSPPGAPSRLADLKRKRGDLRNALVIAELNSGDLAADLAALQAAISEANTLMARVLGWRSFLLSRHDSASSAMAESISQLKTNFGATRQEVENATKEWALRFAGKAA
jgi:hypothetical protein